MIYYIWYKWSNIHLILLSVLLFSWSFNFPYIFQNMMKFLHLPIHCNCFFELCTYSPHLCCTRIDALLRFRLQCVPGVKHLPTSTFKNSINSHLLLSIFNNGIIKQYNVLSCFFCVGTLRFEKPRNCYIEELDQGQHWSLQMHSQQWCGRRELHRGGYDALWVDTLCWTLSTAWAQICLPLIEKKKPLTHIQYIVS